jgi:N-acetylneuraminic acid mutarotase
VEFSTHNHTHPQRRRTRNRFARFAAILAALVLLCVPAAAPSRAAGTPNWQAQYFANATLSGAPALTRADPTIDFDWGIGSPDPAIPVDQFSARWSRTLTLAAATYRFTTYTDDGVRLFIDGVLQIDHWVAQPPTEWQIDLALSAGDHTIVMEYFEGSGDAIARLSYNTIQTDVSPGSWRGEYFGNTTLANQPVFVRADRTIDFDWGSGGPADNFPVNNFSVRWTRDIAVSAGDYRFATYTDDGVRLSIDGVVQIDQWLMRSATYDQIDIHLSDGVHHVVMEYFEAYGDALAKLSWARHANAGEGVVRINTGGGSYADSFNNFWDADTSAYVVDTIATKPSTVTEELQPIWNTTDDQLYINERSGAFRYDVPIANGNYVVRLHFAELFFSAPGVRRFSVAIGGTRVLSSFDIYGQAGKAALITKSFSTSVVTGVLSIDFSKVFDNAAIHALDIYPAGSGSDLTSPTFAAIPEPENVTYTTPPAVTIAISDNVGLNDGYWRLDDQVPQPLFSDLAGATFGGQFTMPVDDFNALALGAHTLSFGANDDNGNAWTQTWHFRKLTSGSGSVPIAFNRRVLVSPTTLGAAKLKHPTALQFGPDGKLYVGQQDGYIHVLTLDANRNVTNVQVINTIHNTPTLNADGSPGATSGRQLIGLDFDPASTPDKPILWAVHSDLRFCFNKTPATCPVNPDSGILTRLEGPAFDTPANRTDFVTGLPRSRENHSPNAVHFGPDGWLYLSIGSDTNFGAPSTAFSGLPERYLTASILRFNVHGAANAFPLDVHTVNSAAGLQPGIFEQYANGFRNPYDFIWHSNGKLYANVNAGNFTAGNTPGPADGCPNGVSFDPGTRNDYLALVEQGDFGGNPNPTHNQCVLDDGTMYSPPKTPDANYHPQKRLLYYSNGTSSDGMAEYTAPTFGGQMLHNIISATYAGNQSVRRVVLADDGRSALFEEDLGIFSQPLDVAVDSAGSIYVGEYGANDIQIMEPNPPLEGTWDTQTPLPVATQELATVACGGKVYAMGGLIQHAVDTGAVWVYDPASKQWTAAAPYTTDTTKYVDHPGAACVNGKVYFFGGLIRAGVAVSNAYEYNPATNTWTPKAAMPAPRGAQGVTVYNNKIYATGGLGYPDKNDLFVYDPATNIWQALAPMPTARDHLTMREVGGKLYALGGRTNVGIDTMTNVNEQYDPATNTWALRAPMPIPRAAMASGTLNGHIQLWGGESPTTNPNATPAGVFKQGYDYDPKTNTWITIADELTPRHGTDGALIGQAIYVPGGAVHQGDAASDVNDVFSFISTAPVHSCIATGSNPHTTDSDSDHYTDQDELDNGTDPCSPASTPPDNDGDHLSDKNDPDDDNDGVLDVNDQFQFDADNGTTTALPWVHNWNPGDPPAGKFGNSGFTGYQLTSHGTGFIADRVHVGGAGGFLSLNATAGTNQGNLNTQDNALQVGFDARHTVTISTRIADPFSGQVIAPDKSGGIFFGLDQDNYVKLVLASNNGTGVPGLVLGVETNGNYVASPLMAPVSINITQTSTLDLFLILDPATKRVIAQYREDSDAPGAIRTIGEIDATALPGLAPFFKLGAAAGVLSTNGNGSLFGLAYDYFRIESSSAPPPITHRVYLPFVRR